MKQLQNDLTTPEQSKRLLELGVPADSADCYYIDSMTSFQDKSPHIIPPDYKYSDGIPNGYESRFCPCWSVGRLIEIYHICDTPGCSFTFNVCFPNLISEMVYKIAEAKERGWIDFSKLEE